MRCKKIEMVGDIQDGPPIPQSQTADKPMTPRRKATQQSQDTKKAN